APAAMVIRITQRKMGPTTSGLSVRRRPGAMKSWNGVRRITADRLAMVAASPRVLVEMPEEASRPDVDDQVGNPDPVGAVLNGGVRLLDEADDFGDGGNLDPREQEPEAEEHLAEGGHQVPVRPLEVEPEQGQEHDGHGPGDEGGEDQELAHPASTSQM